MLARLHAKFFADFAMLPVFGIALAMIVAFFSYAYKDLVGGTPHPSRASSSGN